MQYSHIGCETDATVKIHLFHSINLTLLSFTITTVWINLPYAYSAEEKTAIVHDYPIQPCQM